jgi:hypothetical protein
MVIPVGQHARPQHFYQIDRRADGTFTETQLISVRYVPLVNTFQVPGVPPQSLEQALGDMPCVLPTPERVDGRPTVGDVVKIIKTQTASNESTVGTIGAILEDYGGEFPYKLDGIDKWRYSEAEVQATELQQDKADQSQGTKSAPTSPHAQFHGALENPQSPSHVLALAPPDVKTDSALLQPAGFHSAPPLDPREEEIFYEQRAQLYRHIDHANWAERGDGKVQLIRNKESKMVRFVMRDTSHRVVAGFFVVWHVSFCNLQSFAGSSKCWTWSCQSSSADGADTDTYALKLETPNLARQFKDAFEDAKGPKPKELEDMASAKQSSTESKSVIHVRVLEDCCPQESSGLTDRPTEVRCCLTCPGKEAC